MKSRSLLLLFGVLVSAQAFAQQDTTQTDTTYWTKGGLSRVTFSNVSLSNWAAGGENSTSVASFLSVFADKKKARHKWQNSLDLAYGVLKQGSRPVQKSDDKINFVMRHGYLLNDDRPKWFLTASLDFRTQFAPGFAQEDQDSVISRFLAPGYLTVGTGVEFAPNEYLTFNYKPLTGKITLVTDDEIVGENGAYGVNPGENMRAELGSYFGANYKQEAFKNVKIDSRLELFTNYQKETFGLIDVNWQNSIVMRVNEYLSTNLFTQLIYDDDIRTERVDDQGNTSTGGAQVQLKSVFGIGLVYEFGAERAKK